MNANEAYLFHSDCNAAYVADRSISHLLYSALQGWINCLLLTFRES